MNYKDIWTIELNLDKDFAENCSWHVDRLDQTCNQNISHALEGKSTNRWVLMGIARNLEEANRKSVDLQKKMCDLNGKIPLGLNFAL